jgi:hypothetical protein
MSMKAKRYLHIEQGLGIVYAWIEQQIRTCCTSPARTAA